MSRHAHKTNTLILSMALLMKNNLRWGVVSGEHDLRPLMRQGTSIGAPGMDEDAHSETLQTKIPVGKCASSQPANTCKPRRKSTLCTAAFADWWKSAPAWKKKNSPHLKDQPRLSGPTWACVRILRFISYVFSMFKLTFIFFQNYYNYYNYYWSLPLSAIALFSVGR